MLKYAGGAPELGAAIVASGLVPAMLGDMQQLAAVTPQVRTRLNIALGVVPTMHVLPKAGPEHTQSTGVGMEHGASATTWGRHGHCQLLPPR